MLIVYKIVGHLEGHSRAKFDFKANTDGTIKRTLLPLLSVSERWRKAALESICEYCLLDFDDYRKSREITFPAWPAGFPLLWLGNTHLVRRVIMSATFDMALLEGFFCATLTKLLSNGVVFSTATTLVLNLTTPRELNPSPDDSPRSTITGVLAPSQMAVVDFVRHLKQLAPAAANIHVIIPSINVSKTNHKLLCDLLLSTLCQGAIKGVHVYTEYITLPVSLDVQGLSRLTRISHGRNASCTPFTQLAYRNADTLQTLGVDIGAEADWLSLVYGGTNVPAIFNSLAVLFLTVTGVPYEMTWAAIDFVSPFPVLSTLEVNDGYPFDDDLLFRGNGRTMKNLCIPFCALARNALGRFDVLRRSGISQMNSIRVGLVSRWDEAFLAERGDVTIRQQLCQILGASAALSISSDTHGMLIYATIKTAPSTSSLRHLEFGTILIYIGGVVKIITTCPNLVSLTCKVGDPDLAAGVDLKSAWLTYFRKKKYPLSKSFRVLRVPYSANFSVEEIARVAVHIAVACPSFEFVDIPLEHRKAFGREIAWAMVNRPFNPFADSISRLMFLD